MTKTVLLSVIGALFLGAIIFFGFHARTLQPAAAICTLGDCPQQLYNYDSGEHVLYRVGDQFAVILNEQHDPREHLQCTPAGVIEAAQETSRASTYTAHYKAVRAGTCTLASDHFVVKVSVQ